MVHNGVYIQTDNKSQKRLNPGFWGKKNGISWDVWTELTQYTSIG